MQRITSADKAIIEIGGSGHSAIDLHARELYLTLHPGDGRVDGIHMMYSHNPQSNLSVFTEPNCVRAMIQRNGVEYDIHGHDQDAVQFI